MVFLTLKMGIARPENIKRINKYFETVFERFGEDRVAEVIELIGELSEIAQEELQKELIGSESIRWK